VDHTGYSCRIIRHSRFGHLCGYVGVTPEHPLFGIDYFDERVEDLDANGGITFAGHMNPDLEGFWWFGFDCSHAWDLRPAVPATYCGTAYRTWGFVARGVAALAAQLSQVSTATREETK